VLTKQTLTISNKSYCPSDYELNTWDVYLH